MLHWIDNVTLPAGGYGNSAGGFTWKVAWYIYHFLRVLGWKCLAECDSGYSGTASVVLSWKHITDGSMEASGTTSWTAVGSASVSKSTTQHHCGEQSLTFTTTSSGDGVQSAAFSQIANSATYQLTLWAWNNCGHNLTVYVDTGTGSWTLLGTIADNSGVWTQHQWEWTAHSSGTRYLKVVDETGTVAAGEVYLDTISTCYPGYEKVRGSGTDGAIGSSNNEFSSASYAFTDDDISNAREVCLADMTNSGNSGIYTVVGRNGSAAILQVNDGGVGTYLTAATGLTFRVLDSAADYPQFAAYSGDPRIGRGFIIESPHSSKWRIKVRDRWQFSGSTDNMGPHQRWWSSPEDCEYNIETFQFLKKQRSTCRNMMADQMAFEPWVDGHSSGSAYRTGGSARLYAVTDGETFVFASGRHSWAHDAFFMGFLGDNTLDLEDTYAHIQGSYGAWNGANFITFTSSAETWEYYAATFSRNGLAAFSSIGMAGYAASTGVAEYMTNAKANPWSGEETIRPIMLFCDREAANGQFQIIEATNQSIGICRSNLTQWTPFGASREWFHLVNGLCIAWNGRQVAP